jgi:tetratricopeptide (TPR) repeat protein
MDMNQVLEGLDELFETHQLDRVEGYLEEQLMQAVEENDLGAMISILNEMLGFARETSQYDKCQVYAAQALRLIENSPYKGTLSHATTLLNVATAMRAAGQLEQSQERYAQVEAIYKEQLPENDYQYAGLYNNKGLLFEEMQEYENAAQSFAHAIEIISCYEGNEYYQAVSYANLANAQVVLGQYEQAAEHAQRAIDIFDDLGVADSHKGAALAAFGEVHQARGKLDKAIVCYEQARDCILNHIGKNASYYRVEERLKELKKLNGGEAITGAALCREYYEKYGAPMLLEQFPEYVSKIAVGHVGEGSDCFGFDDDISRDHDFGPGFSMWVSQSTYDAIGDKLQQAYMALPEEYKGYRRVTSGSGSERFGVCVVDDFYKRVLAGSLPVKDNDYLSLEDCYLAAAVNGEVYRDDEGIFTAIREKLKLGYPEGVKLLKLAQRTALFGQNGQYNYERCAKRGEWTGALLAKGEALRLSMQIVYLMSGSYAPHDKWLHRGLEHIHPKMYSLIEKLTQCELTNVEENVKLLENVAQLILELLKGEFYVTAKGDFLPDLAVEIARRGQLSMMSNEELAASVISLEEDYKKEAGMTELSKEEAEDCRKAFFGTWTKGLLVQYRYDLENRQVYTLRGKDVPQQRMKIVDTILEVERDRIEKDGVEKHSAEKDTDYMKFLEERIYVFSDAMLVQYGRYAASKQIS